MLQSGHRKNINSEQIGFGDFWGPNTVTMYTELQTERLEQKPWGFNGGTKISYLDFITFLLHLLLVNSRTQDSKNHITS